MRSGNKIDILDIILSIIKNLLKYKRFFKNLLSKNTRVHLVFFIFTNQRNLVSEISEICADKGNSTIIYCCIRIVNNRCHSWNTSRISVTTNYIISVYS